MQKIMLEETGFGERTGIGERGSLLGPRTLKLPPAPQEQWGKKKLGPRFPAQKKKKERLE